MTTTAMRSNAPGTPTGSAGFGPLLWAEWIKFRTVRGWVIGVVLAGLLTVGIAMLDHSSCGGQVSAAGPVVTGAGCSVPLGPAGEAVSDRFYFVHRPLAGGSSITARVTSLTGARGPAGLAPWSKAGIIVQASTQPGSAYAAMMVTAGHGVRMQDDYTGDIAGLPGAVSSASPRWLRLTRSGDTLTGYESADGTHWTTVGTAHLAGLPATVQAGMFAAAPASSKINSQSITGSSESGTIGLAAARFDHLSVSGQRPSDTWAGDPVGGASPGTGFHQAGGITTVTGSGDIGPYVGVADGPGTPVEQTQLGAFGGLIAVIVVATMFITAEYRRGLIRVTFAATPARGRVLAAKAVVIGGITFIAGLAGGTAALLLGERLLRSNGNFILPVSALTEVRVVAGTAGLFAVTAVLALAVGTLLRHGAGAVTTLIVAIVLPYFFATALPVLPAAAADWLLRFTPAAAFAIQQTISQYPQVSAPYTPANGYFPLPPWAGFAVLCGYAALALGLAVVLLRRRDA